MPISENWTEAAGELPRLAALFGQDPATIAGYVVVLLEWPGDRDPEDVYVQTHTDAPDLDMVDRILSRMLAEYREARAKGAGAELMRYLWPEGAEGPG